MQSSSELFSTESSDLSFEVFLTPELKSQHEQRVEKRKKLLVELFTSEDVHVAHLQGVIVNYRRPLEQILTIQQIKSLFGNFESILNWNMDFRNQLKVKIIDDNFGESNIDAIGEIMVKMFVILRQLFTAYNENYKLAQKTYQDCLKNQEFESFVRSTSNLKDSKTNLLTSLYLPIQRIIMYDSLLKEILLLTPRNHHNFASLCNAYQQLRSMDIAANRVAEKRRNLDTVLRIQNSLIGDECIAAPHRYFVFEEDLSLVVGKSHKERTLYLFNDLLLLAKMRKKNKYEVEFMLMLTKITIEPHESDRNSFKVITGEGNNREEYIFSSEHKITWIELLNSTKKKLQSKPAEGSATANNVKLLPEEQADPEGHFWMDVESRSDLSKELLAEKILAWNALAGDEENHEKIFREMRKLSKLIMREKSHTLAVVGPSREYISSSASLAEEKANISASRKSKTGASSPSVNKTHSNNASGVNSPIISSASSNGPSPVVSTSNLNTNASSTTATSTTGLSNKSVVSSTTNAEK